MPHCDLAKQCAFFTVRDEGAEMREYLTQLYCAGNFSDCARYRAAMEMGQLVRDDIFPNEDAFLSLFAWSVNSGESPVSKRCRSHSLGRPSFSVPKKTEEPSGLLPATRQTRSQH